MDRRVSRPIVFPLQFLRWRPGNYKLKGTVEKVVGVPTFVMKGASKVYLFKLEPHDEVMMRTWIGAVSQQL